jgi:hypothetical protein
MSILNYTTEVSVSKTIQEIHAKLAGAKAEAILTEYEPDGIASAVSFRVPRRAALRAAVLVWFST